MITWTSDNLPATTTWFNLRTLGEIPKTLAFKNAQNVKVSELTFFNPTASDEARRIAAGALAASLDGQYRNFWGGGFKEGVTKAGAIGALTDVLVQADNTLFTIANAADGLYQF